MDKFIRNKFPILLLFLPMLSNALTFGSAHLNHSSQPDSNGWYTLSYVDETPAIYDHVGYGSDTAAVVFNPIAPCSVHVVEVSWYTTGPVNVFAADYNDAMEPLAPGGVSSGFPTGTLAISPIGSLYTTGAVTDVENSVFHPMDVGGPFQAGDPDHFTSPPFVIGITTPQAVTAILLDYPASNISHTWLGYDGTWGNFYNSQLEIHMRVLVSYPWGRPPIITDMTPIPNTLDGNRQFHISASIIDDGSFNEAWLRWGINTDSPSDSVTMTVVNDSVYSGVFNPQAASLDTVYFSVSATDNTGLYTHTKPDPKHRFIVKPRHHPNAEVLLLDTSAPTTSGSGRSMQQIYATLSDSLCVEFEYWNIPGNNGLAPGVVLNQSWKTILMVGHEYLTFPVFKARNDPLWTEAFQSGINMILVNQHIFDYGSDDTLHFAAGEIGYDYFGIDQAIGIHQNHDFHAVRGVSNDILTGFASDSLYDIANYFESNSMDYVRLNDAEPIWVTESGEISGIRNQNDSVKTVGIFFPIENFNSFDYDFDHPVLAPEFTHFFGNILNWMGIPVNIASKTPTTFPEQVTLFPTYPNPFNGSTTIRFYIPRKNEVNLAVYDITGKKIASIFQSQVEAGMHKFDWVVGTGELSSGIYYLRLQTNNYVVTQKMVLLK